MPRLVGPARPNLTNLILAEDRSTGEFLAALGSADPGRGGAWEIRREGVPVPALEYLRVGARVGLPALVAATAVLVWTT